MRCNHGLYTDSKPPHPAGTVHGLSHQQHSAEVQGFQYPSTTTVVRSRLSDQNSVNIADSIRGFLCYTHSVTKGVLQQQGVLYLRKYQKYNKSKYTPSEQLYLQGVPWEMCQTSAECSPRQSTPIQPKTPTYIRSWTVTEIMAREVWKYDSCYTLID